MLPIESKRYTNVLENFKKTKKRMLFNGLQIIKEGLNGSGDPEFFAKMQHQIAKIQRTIAAGDPTRS